MNELGWPAVKIEQAMRFSHELLNEEYRPTKVMVQTLARSFLSLKAQNQQLRETLAHAIQFCTWIREDSIKLQGSEVATLARRNKVTYSKALGLDQV